MTTNKNLNTPTNGSYVGDWDVPVNANWNYIDAAFGGVTSLSATSGTVTLSATQYTPPNLEISGSLSGNVAYKLPSGVGGIWSIYNGATLNGYSVTFSVTSGGTPYTLPVGFRVLLISDGTNVAEADNTASAVGANTQVIFNSGGFLSGSSNLTFDGTNLSISGATAATQTYVTTYAPSKTGSGASGTWGINISGNAATATNATNATNATTATNLNGGSVTATTITATGNITAYYSDDRLKTRLGYIDGALAKVMSLKGFYYEANAKAQALGYKPVREVGLSAQDVRAIMPEVVAPAPIDPQYLTLDYARLVPLLVEAIKEQQILIDALSKKIGRI